MVSAGLANVDSLAQDRMADSAVWIKGCGLMEWESVCRENREVADDIALAASPIADLIMRFVNCEPLGGEVKLQPSDLLDKLKGFAQEAGIELDPKLFPRTGKALSDRIMRDKPALARRGIGVERLPRSNGVRYLELRKLPIPAALSAALYEGSAALCGTDDTLILTAFGQNSAAECRSFALSLLLSFFIPERKKRKEESSKGRVKLRHCAALRHCPIFPFRAAAPGNVSGNRSGQLARQNARSPPGPPDRVSWQSWSAHEPEAFRPPFLYLVKMSAKFGFRKNSLSYSNS